MASWIYSTPSKEDTNNGNKGRSHTSTPDSRARSATYLSSRGQFANVDVCSSWSSQIYPRDTSSVTVRSHHSNSFLNIRPYATEKFKSTVGRRTFLAQIRADTNARRASSNASLIACREDSCCLSSSTSTSTSTLPSAPTSPSTSASFSIFPSSSSTPIALSKFLIIPNALCDFSPPTDVNISIPTQSLSLYSTISSSSNACSPTDLVTSEGRGYDNYPGPLTDSSSSSSIEAEDMSRTPSNMSISSDPGSTQDDFRIEQGNEKGRSEGYDDWESIIDNTVSFLISGYSPTSSDTLDLALNVSSGEGDVLSFSGDYEFEVNAIGGPWPLPCVFDDYRLRTESSIECFQGTAKNDSLTEHGQPSAGGAHCPRPSQVHHLDEVQYESECEGKCEVTDETAIMFAQDGMPKLKAAHLCRIVSKLTCDKHNDSEFTEICLLTYRMFTDPQTFFASLRQRYENTKNDKVRLKVCRVLKQWLENNEFCGECSLLSSVALFLETVSLDYPMSAIQLKRASDNPNSFPNPNPSCTSLSPPRQSQITANALICPMQPQYKVSGFGSFDTQEVARQLALMEFEWFSQIRPEELLDKKWAHSKHEAANVCSMIARSNTIPFWVATEIVQRDQLEERVAILRKFICIAEHCRTLCNYNGLMEILSGLNMTAIHRLKRTWGALAPKSLAIFRDLNQLMSPDSNFKAYREVLKKLNNTTHPRVPYLGRYLTDLVFAEDAMSLHLQNGLIHFWKCKSIAQIIWDLTAHQKQSYTFNSVPLIQSYLQSSKGLTESALLKLSRKLEPKASSG